jgi:hypothetical protein
MTAAREDAWGMSTEVARMIDRVQLLIGLLSNDDDQDTGGVTVFEVAAMLYELGEEHRAQAALALVTT